MSVLCKHTHYVCGYFSSLFFFLFFSHNFVSVSLQWYCCCYSKITPKYTDLANIPGSEYCSIFTSNRTVLLLQFVPDFASFSLVVFRISYVYWNPNETEMKIEEWNEYCIFYAHYSVNVFVYKYKKLHSYWPYRYKLESSK